MSAEEVRDVRRSLDDSPYSALADDIEGEISEEVEQTADEALDGGVGSGNFNHAGRLGLRGGSAKGENSNTILFTSIQSDEEQIRNLPDEKGLIYDKNGNYIDSIDGKGLTINGGNNVDKILILLNDKIFTHNHPNNTTFSKQDLITAFKLTNIIELRAVTPDGFTYSIKPLLNSDIDGLLKEYQKIDNDAIKRYDAKLKIELNSGIISQQQYNERKDDNTQFRSYQLHRMLKEKAKDYGFKYERNISI